LVHSTPDDRDEDDGRKAVDKNIKVGYEGGMAENTQAIDLVHEILAATFGPNTAAEAVKDDAVDASGSSPVGDDGAVGPADRPSGSAPSGTDGSSTSLPPTSPATAADAEVGPSDLPRWWKHNLDGTPRKTCQAPDVLKGFPHGETRQRETDLLVLKALHAGCETLVELVAHTTFVKVTCTRSLERLVEEGRVVQTKAPPSGRRGRPAHLYRPTTEAVEPDTTKADAGAPTDTGVEE
jgi:hypothetical protein